MAPVKPEQPLPAYGRSVPKKRAGIVAVAGVVSTLSVVLMSACGIVREKLAATGPDPDARALAHEYIQQFGVPSGWSVVQAETHEGTKTNAWSHLVISSPGDVDSLDGFCKKAEGRIGNLQLIPEEMNCSATEVGGFIRKDEKVNCWASFGANPADLPRFQVWVECRSKAGQNNDIVR
jgi:hypothetical protein